CRGGEMGPQRSPRRSGYCCVALVLALAVLGCSGRPTGTVAGRVTFKGQLVTTGLVSFVRTDGRTATGRIQKDGTYTIYGAPVGRVTVLVDPKLRSSHAAKGPAGGGADLVLPSADEMETAGTSLPISRSEAIP